MNIDVTSGDDYLGDRRLTITVTDKLTGDTIDLTGISLTFRVAPRLSDETIIDKTIASGIELADQLTNEGQAYIELQSSDTATLAGPYRWELEGDDVDGIITLARGRFYVEPDLITA